MKAGKKAKFSLGVYEPKLGSAIQEATSIPCVSNEHTSEILRGVRMHFDRFVKGLDDSALKKAQLGLSHSYSRAKVKFNIHKVDNMIIQVMRGSYMCSMYSMGWGARPCLNPAQNVPVDGRVTPIALSDEPPF